MRSVGTRVGAVVCVALASVGFVVAAPAQASTAPRPVGAGFIASQSRAQSGALSFTVPKATCASASSTWTVHVSVGSVQIVSRSDNWGIDVYFGCAHGKRFYRSDIYAGTFRAHAATARPGGVVTLSYTKHDILYSVKGPGTDDPADGCGRAAADKNQPSIAYLVAWTGGAPHAVAKIKYRATANGAPLGRTAPRAQGQRVGAHLVLAPSKLAAGVFTVARRAG